MNVITDIATGFLIFFALVVLSFFLAIIDIHYNQWREKREKKEREEFLAKLNKKEKEDGF